MKTARNRRVKATYHVGWIETRPPDMRGAVTGRRQHQIVVGMKADAVDGAAGVAGVGDEGRAVAVDDGDVGNAGRAV